MAESKHASVFRTTKLGLDERIRASCEGFIGDDEARPQHFGALIVTSHRVAFYRKGWFGEVLESMPLDKITSIERKTLLGHKVLRLHTSHDQLVFKTFEPWDSIMRLLEERGSSAGAAPAPASPAPDTHLDRLQKLGGLRDAGLITEAEFAAKRAEILAQV